MTAMVLAVQVALPPALIAWLAFWPAGVFVRVNGERRCLWRALDHEGEVLEVYVTKTQDRRAALDFLRRALKRLGSPCTIVTDYLRSYRAALSSLGIVGRQDTARWLDNRAESPISRSDDESDPCNVSEAMPRFRN